MKRLRRAIALMGFVLLACGGMDGGGSASDVMPTSPEALAVASSLGIPQVAPGAGVAGPFVGPEATIYYLDQGGRVTFFNPQTFVAYMAQLAPERFTYIMAPQGFYAVSGDAVTQLDGPPPDIGQWPQAEPLAGIMVAHLEQIQQQIQQGTYAGGAGGQDAAYWQMMSEMSRAQHETNMAIINNMGSSGCVEHYEGPYYVGCW